MTSDEQREIAWMRMQSFNQNEQMKWFEQKYTPTVDWNKVLTIYKLKDQWQLNRK